MDVSDKIAAELAKRDAEFTANLESRAVQSIVDDLRRLPEERRMEAFRNFCTHCGSDNPRCQCWNDE